MGKLPTIIKKIIAKIFTPDRLLSSFPILSTPNKLMRVTPMIIALPSNAIETSGNHTPGWISL